MRERLDYAPPQPRFPGWARAITLVVVAVGLAAAFAHLLVAFVIGSRLEQLAAVGRVALAGVAVFVILVVRQTLLIRRRRELRRRGFAVLPPAADDAKNPQAPSPIPVTPLPADGEPPPPLLPYRHVQQRTPEASSDHPS